MMNFQTSAEYKAAVRVAISSEFERNELGTPSQVHLVEKHTSDGYLFFIAFVHFTCEPLTPSASAFRYSVTCQGEQLLHLRSGRYWRVKKYLEASSENATLVQQKRLDLDAHVSPTLVLPKLTRNGLVVLTESTSPQLATKTLRQAFQDHLIAAQDSSAKEVLGDPMPPVPLFDLEWPPAYFDDWLISENSEVKLGYEDARRQGHNSIMKQYHEEARRWHATANIV
tara:strand:+ start:15541 stop:16218 length:678 start_codon:yes stop_codon:yes gene_type:complete